MVSPIIIIRSLVLKRHLSPDPIGLSTPSAEKALPVLVSLQRTILLPAPALGLSFPFLKDLVCEMSSLSSRVAFFFSSPDKRHKSYCELTWLVRKAFVVKRGIASFVQNHRLRSCSLLGDFLIHPDELSTRILDFGTNNFCEKPRTSVPCEILKSFVLFAKKRFSNTPCEIANKIVQPFRTSTSALV